MNFADQILASSSKRKSVLVAGFDPMLDSIPQFILEKAKSTTKNREDFLCAAISSFYLSVLDSVHHSIAAIKPNLAFYEQYGLGGLRAYLAICEKARTLELPIIADAKRGDIGSTAQAYSSAFLGKDAAFQAEALTVNPFLGFDTIEPFLKDCREHGRGIFVLVCTSNPGSATLQKDRALIAQFLNDNAAALMGDSGYSSLGAVVGATKPSEAIELRKLMPKNIFLIPGYGAQGASAQDAVAGFGPDKRGAFINVSRGLCAGIPKETGDHSQLSEVFTERIEKMNREIGQAL